MAATAPATPPAPASTVVIPATPSSTAASPAQRTEDQADSLSLGFAGLDNLQGLQGTPRIDISRASSSSQQDDSSPERELTAGGDSTGGGAKLLGFLEEGTDDLRSSTEELQFLEEPGTVEDQERRRRHEKRQRKESTQSCGADLAPTETAGRKDSTCSAEVAYLTGRLNSVSSAASARSSAAPSRSPSPGKLLLETSFCGTRPASAVSKEGPARGTSPSLGGAPSPQPSGGQSRAPGSRPSSSAGQGSDSEAPGTRRDSAASFRRDSEAAGTRRDSAASVRRDSEAAGTRRDSAASARRDSESSRERQRKRTMERQVALEGEAHHVAHLEAEVPGGPTFESDIPAPQSGVPDVGVGRVVFATASEKEERERQARKIAAKRADEVRRAQGKEPRPRTGEAEASPPASDRQKMRGQDRTEDAEWEKKRREEAVRREAKEREKQERQEKGDKPRKRRKSKTKDDPNALVRIIPLHSSDETGSEDGEDADEDGDEVTDMRRRVFQGVDDGNDDLEVQRRRWLETHVSRDEDPELVRIIPLRTASVEQAEMEREKRESGDPGTSSGPRRTPRSTPSPKRPVVEAKLEKTSAVLEQQRPSSRTSEASRSRSPQPPRSPQLSLSPQPPRSPQPSLSPQPPRSPQPPKSPQPSRSPQRSPDPTSGASGGGQRAPGRVRGRRRGDPNALVRIIPLHSEDSYEGYGEDDNGPPPPPLDETMHDLGLPHGMEAPKRPKKAKASGDSTSAPSPRPTDSTAGSSRSQAAPRTSSTNGGPRVPGKLRKGRTYDPNATVRIIPLHSEDSYDGYSEDERPPPNLESPDEPATTPPKKLSMIPETQQQSPATTEPPKSPLRPKSSQMADPPPSPKAPPSPKPSSSPKPPSSTQPSSPKPRPSTQPPAQSSSTSSAAVNDGAGPSSGTQRLPGKPRGPRRKVDPNALVRIIPLKSEDSYEGYGEDDLLPGEKQATTTRVRGTEGVDVIVDEIDMSKWREPSFEENDMVRIIPLKGEPNEPLAKPARPPAKNVPIPKVPAGYTPGNRTRGDGRASKADASSSRRSPMMPPEEELVKIIPLHTPDEEKEFTQTRAPSSLDRSPRSPLPSPGVGGVVGVEQVSRSEPVRRRRRSDPKTQPGQPGQTGQPAQPGQTGQEEVVRTLQLHSDSDSETELAGYAAAARAARERPRKSSDGRTGSRAGSTSRASSRPGSARSERMEQLQIVPLTDPDCVEETGVCFTRRDLAIQQGRLTPSTLDWHSHGRNTPLDQSQGPSPQVGDGKPATPATLDLSGGPHQHHGASPRPRRRDVDGQAASSRSPSPPPPPPAAGAVSAGRKASLSSVLFRRAEQHSPESPSAPVKQRRASAAPTTSSAISASLPKSRDRHHQPPLSGESGKQRRESRDAGKVSVTGMAVERRESRDAGKVSVTGMAVEQRERDASKENKPLGASGVFSTLFRKKSIPLDRPESGPTAPCGPPTPPERYSSATSGVLPIEGVEFTFTCEGNYKESSLEAPAETEAFDGFDVSDEGEDIPLPSVSVNMPATSPPGASPSTPPGTTLGPAPGSPPGRCADIFLEGADDLFGEGPLPGSPQREPEDPPADVLPAAPPAQTQPTPPAVPKKSASRDSWPAPPPPLDTNANPSGHADEDRHSRHSSGSEREVVPPPPEQPDGEDAEDAEEDHETKGLVLQQDSFDDELPYVPTTLPMERSVAVPLVPVKERLAAEMKTCPIDRPRSTTPINPTALEEFVAPGSPGAGASQRAGVLTPAAARAWAWACVACSALSWCLAWAVSRRGVAAALLQLALHVLLHALLHLLLQRLSGAGAGGREKLRISLPRTDSLTRRSRPQTRPWHDFASQALKPRSDSQSPPPPPLPPRAPPATPPASWINFDEVPEKRKAPVRIQTIPTRGSIVTDPGAAGRAADSSGAAGSTATSGHSHHHHHHHHVHYVDPEDCRCECHESEHRPAPSAVAPTAPTAPVAPTAPTAPTAPARPPKARPFGMDLDVSGGRSNHSNRSSVASQNEHSSPEGPG